MNTQARLRLITNGILLALMPASFSTPMKVSAQEQQAAGEVHPSSMTGPANAADPWARVPAILARIAPPKFPPRRFPITMFGAVGDGNTDCTTAFRRAIDECHGKGGGRVVVPAGRYSSGAIHLRSHVDLHLEEGAEILFIQDPARYLPAVPTRYEGNDCVNYSACIYALNQRNVAITGTGVIDGRGNVPVWQKMDRDPRDQENLRRMAEAGVPAAQRVFGAGHNLRPNLIQFNGCSGVLVEGVTLRDGPMWTLHPLLCTNVTIRKVTIESNVPNGDGIDPESTRDIHISDCTFATRDDGIALKAGRNADGRRLGIPCENVVVQRCRVLGVRGARNGMAVGSEMSGGVRNVYVEDCVISSRLRGISLKTNTKRGGFIEDIYFRNLKFQKLRDSVLLIDMTFGQEKGPFSPWIRRVELRNVVVRGARRIWEVDTPNPAALSEVGLIDCDFNEIKSDSTPRYVARLSQVRTKTNGVLVIPPSTPLLNASPPLWMAVLIGLMSFLMGLVFARGKRRYSLPLLLLLWLACGLVLQAELSLSAWSAQPIPLVENRRVALAWSLGSLAAILLGVLFHARVWLRKYLFRIDARSKSSLPVEGA